MVREKILQENVDLLAARAVASSSEPEKNLRFKDPRAVTNKSQLGIFVESLLFSEDYSTAGR